MINQLVSTAWATAATVGMHPKNIATIRTAFIEDFREHANFTTNASLDLERVRMKTPPEKLNRRCSQEKLSKKAQ
jgi:hypothetical protein